MGEYDGKIVLFFGCMERLENEFVQEEMRDVVRQGGAVIEVRNPGATVTPKMLQELRDIVDSNRRIAEFRFRPHTGCGAKGVAFAYLAPAELKAQKTRVSNTAKNDVSEPYMQLKGSRDLDEFERASAELDAEVIRHVVIRGTGIKFDMNLLPIKPIKQRQKAEGVKHESVVLVTDKIDATPEQILRAGRIADMEGAYVLVASNPELLETGVEVAVRAKLSKDVRLLALSQDSRNMFDMFRRLHGKAYFKQMGATLSPPKNAKVNRSVA